MPLSDQTRAQAREIIARYPKPRSALLPMLHLVQAEEGCVTPAGVALCAEELGLTLAEVGAVATFYTMYKRRPVGNWLVSVCTNLSCQLLGGDEVFARVSRHLGVGHDATTEDGRFTLEHAECLAACDYAPVMTVNYEFFDNVTPDSALALVRALENGERPHPTRGESLVDFREISRQLAGITDVGALREAVDAASVAHPTPPVPVDSRDSVDTTGTDVAPTADAGEFGVPAGVTERVLPGASAAATYGGGPSRPDAGAADPAAGAGPAEPPPGTGPAEPPPGTGPAEAEQGAATLNTPESAGHARVSQFADPDKGFLPDESADQASDEEG